MISLTVNGKPQNIDVSADMPLLWVIRDVVGLTGTKFGCGLSQCGACTVHLNGEPIRSCVTPASAALAAVSGMFSLCCGRVSSTITDGGLFWVTNARLPSA